MPLQDDYTQAKCAKLSESTDISHIKVMDLSSRYIKTLNVYLRCVLYVCACVCRCVCVWGGGGGVHCSDLTNVNN